MNASIIATKHEKILNEECNLEWKVNLSDMSTPIHTPVFTATANSSANFYFEVWFQTIHSGSNACSSLQVVLRKLSGPSVHPDLRFQLFVSVYYSNDKLYIESDNAIALNSFTSKTCINDVKRVYDTTHGDYLRTKILILKCRMICNGHLLSPKLYYNETDALHYLRSFSKNFEALYQSNELSDVSIQVGEKTFRSHKFVLAAHSPVFKRMLEHDFLETKTGVITIIDFEPDVFEGFLKFFYTGEVEGISFSDFKQLYTLADKYEAQTLKQVCVTMLTYFNINEDQIEDIFQLAYQCNDDNLKKAAKNLYQLTVIKK